VILLLNKSNFEIHLLSWLSFGVFLILVGILFLVTPNLWEAVEGFFGDFTLRKVDGNIYFPAPEHNHAVLYNALSQFCLWFGIYQIVLLALKIYLGATIYQKAETFSDIIFWLLAGYFLVLLKEQGISWFAFIGVFILLVGIVILIRSVVPLFFKTFKKLGSSNSCFF